MPRTSDKELSLTANDPVVRAAVAREGKPTEYKIRDSDGLTLRVEPSGKAAYYVRYTASGNRRRLRIGARDVVTLKDARSRAKEVALSVVRGEDPVAAAARRAASLTFRELWEERRKLDSERAARTMGYYDEALRKYAFPEFGEVPAEELSTDQVAALLRKIQRHSKSVAHAVRCAIGSTYRWGFSQRLVRNNPTTGLGFVYASKPRNRDIEASEIGALWNGIDAERGFSARMRFVLKLLLLTGQRNSTVAGARADELKSLDTANPVWKIGRQRMKNKARDHVLPLTPLAASLFGAAMEQNGDGAVFVFPTEGAGDGHFDHRSVSRAMARLCAKLGVDDLHVHDFRKAMTTWFAENGISYDVRSRIMHHSAPDVTSRNYDFSLLNGPMREALSRWERYVLECAACAESGQTTENVVALKRA